MCKFHWQRWRTGIPLDAPLFGHRRPGRRYGPKAKPASDKLAARIPEDRSGCWDWPGARSTQGYGIVVDATTGKRVQVYAHRVSYELHIGPIPEGLEIDHVCRNRACFNPAHLEAVTHGENIRRSWVTRRLAS